VHHAGAWVSFQPTLASLFRHARNVMVLDTFQSLERFERVLEKIRVRVLAENKIYEKTSAQSLVSTGRKLRVL